MHRLAESGLGFVQENNRAGDAVKGQGSRPVVQIHPHPAAAGAADGHALLVVLEATGCGGAVQAPRLGVVAQLAVARSSAPAHAFVADADRNAFGASPLHLPVAAAGHAGAAQHLGPAGEASWVLRVGLWLGARGHLSAAVGEAEVRVGRVRVQAHLAVIWTHSGVSGTGGRIQEVGRSTHIVGTRLSSLVQRCTEGLLLLRWDTSMIQSQP